MFYLTTHSTHFIYGYMEMFYLTTHSTHFIYGYMASDILLRTILIVRKETRCRHIGYSFRLAARVLLYAPSHRQDSTYHGLCYTSRGALASTNQNHWCRVNKGSVLDYSFPHQKNMIFNFSSFVLYFLEQSVDCWCLEDHQVA